MCIYKSLCICYMILHIKCMLCNVDYWGVIVSFPFQYIPRLHVFSSIAIITDKLASQSADPFPR